MPNVRSEYSEHYFRDYQSVIPKSTYPIAWSYYNFLSSHWLAIWCIFRRSPLSEENYPNRNPAWKQALLTIDFQGNTRKGSSTSLSVVAKLTELAEKLPTRGFDVYYNRIRTEGLVWNRKRVLRVYRGMKLGMRRRHKKRVPTRIQQPLETPGGLNEVWSMDFMSDALSDGRRVRMFNVIDDYNREALAVEPGLSFPATRVTRVLNQLEEEIGLPKA